MGKREYATNSTLTIPESLARAIFQAAINEGRAGELLESLFDGATATVDIQTGKLLIAWLHRDGGFSAQRPEPEGL